MMEAQDPASDDWARALYARRQSIGTDAFQALGLNGADAELESRLSVDSIFGLQYDLVINRVVDRATTAFRYMMKTPRARRESLLAAPASWVSSAP